MAERFAFDVFLSHNSQDKPQVRPLAERLKAAGLRVWFDEWAIRPGDDIYLAIEKGLQAARTQVLCLSQTALDSEWVRLERSTVLFRDPTNAGRRFIPLLLADCQLPDTLRRYKYVDWRQGTEAAFAELLVACRGEGEEASTAPTVGPERRATEMKPRPPMGQARKPKPPNSPAQPAQAQVQPLAVLERKLTGHKDWVSSVAISPDGSWAASGSLDKTVKVWHLESGECRATLEGHTDSVKAVAITPDGRRIVSGSSDQSVRVWDSDSGREVVILSGHTDKVWSVIALRDNAHAFSGGFDNTLRLWELASGECLKTIECEMDEADSIFGTAVNATGTQALSGHRDGTIRLWDLETGLSIATLKGHTGIVKSVQITPDGRSAVSGSDDKTVKLWDLEAGACVGTLEGHQNHVHSVALSPDGRWIASTGFTDETVRLWDRATGACLQVIEYEGHPSPISAAFSPDGSGLLVGTTKGLIYLYRLTAIHTKSSTEPARRYVNAKVVLIGEGTVGKTSLAHRLIDDEYVVRDRTHGMNVWRLELPDSPPHPGPLSGQEEAGIEEREALLWDLAGQEDYRLVHQLFLEETALALLLINPQKADPYAEAGDWLKALQTVAGNHASKREAARLLVYSQVDVGEPKLGRAKIERFAAEYGFADWLLTSAKNGRNCSDRANGGQPSPLKQLIARHIPWDRLPWTSTPALLAELKNTILAMRDEQDIRLLRFAELAQRLEQALPDTAFDEQDVRTAVTLLANHGLARPLTFGDLVLLQPELINGYASAIIRAARGHTDEIGCVLQEAIFDSGFDFTGVDRLGRPDEELLLHALLPLFLDHALCIAEETPQGRHLVFPSQYRREKTIPYQPETFVSYSFSGEWQTVWTTLVVRLWYSNEFAHKELWRNAAEFEDARGRLLGLKIDNQQGEGRAAIQLYFDHAVPDELKVIFIEYVHRHLARHACEVGRDRRYLCGHCGKPVQDLETVRERLAAGKSFIYCQKCDEKVGLIDFIEQRLKSDPVAQRILKMDETAARRLDTQALEQILIGHLMAVCGEANQIFRPVTMADYGIDGEVEFRDDDGQPSGRKVYVQLKSGDSYLRTRKSDGREIFDVKKDRHLEYWVNQPVDVYLVIRQSDELRGEPSIRWMNLTRYLQQRPDKASRQIVFEGERLDLKAVWGVRDGFFPPCARPDGRG